MPKSILLIEDDPDIAELVRYNLVKESYRCTVSGDGAKGLALAGRQAFDLVLLDVMLPGMGGLEVLKGLRKAPATAAVPVMLVSAKGEETDIVLGLELGAEDYLVKPFSPKVLVARVKALLRRGEAAPAGEAQAPVVIGHLRIDPSRMEASVSGKAMTLTLTEFKLLQVLAARPGHVLTRNQLLDAARGADTMVMDRTIDVHLSSLRRKLGRMSDHLETVRGVGYRFRE